MNVNYKVIKSNRKTTAITISKDGNVIVRTSKYASSKYISDLVYSKKDWILTQLNKINNANKKYIDVINGKSSLVLGQIVPKISNVEYNGRAKAYLTYQINQISNKIGLFYSKISFKNYKSRWGCCNKNKEITLNYKLFSLNEGTINYVIIHELCHTVYMNHKKEFNNLVYSFCGNVKEYKNNLKEVGFILKLKN